MITNVDKKVTGNIRSPNSIKGNINSGGGSLAGRVTGGGSSRMLVNTTAGWNTQSTLIGAVNTVYVYSDYMTNSEGKPIPGFKIGDGTTYLIDLPFSDELMVNHMQDTQIHITEEERNFWNSKNRAIIAGENLVLTDL